MTESKTPGSRQLRCCHPAGMDYKGPGGAAARVHPDSLLPTIAHTLNRRCYQPHRTVIVASKPPNVNGPARSEWIERSSWSLLSSGSATAVGSLLEEAGDRSSLTLQTDLGTSVARVFEVVERRLLPAPGSVAGGVETDVDTGKRADFSTMVPSRPLRSCCSRTARAWAARRSFAPRHRRHTLP